MPASYRPDVLYGIIPDFHVSADARWGRNSFPPSNLHRRDLRWVRMFYGDDMLIARLHIPIDHFIPHRDKL
jgi:hypothetical protein